MLSSTDLAKRNNICISGNGDQALLFAHGYGCDQNMWRFITPAFENDFKIVLFDHTGSGKSDTDAYDFAKYDSLEGYADDIIEICDAFDFRNVILTAHSVSAMIAVIAARKRPELFSKLILIGPSPRYINDESYTGGFTKEDIDELVATLDSNFLGWSSFITPVITGNPDKPEVAEELKNSFCRMNPEIAKHFAKVTFLSDNREDLPQVSTPSLVIQCDPDAISPIVVGKYVHDNLPDSEFALLKTSGHCPHLTAPEETIQAINNFLRNES